MLKPAILYRNELEVLYRQQYYKPELQYYTGWVGAEALSIPDEDTGERHYFAVLDNENIIGYISYTTRWYEGVASNFGIISFRDKPSYIFGKAVLEVVHNIFTKYNFRKMSWSMIGGNPIERAYKKFCDKYGGRVAGRYTDEIRLTDGSYHDSVMFELTRENYLKSVAEDRSR